ncbi:MAG TPA: FAD-binding oxidoreductase [Baekduia sp.]|jgi:FAD/FMN-containing dehydrogenase
MTLTLIARGDPGFEQARTEAVWNGRRPDRLPDLIAQATDAEAVVAAVGIAKARGLKISIRSGGHNFVGASVRDGGMLLDVSALDAVAVDPDARRAVVGPGCQGETLLQHLRPHGLAFGVGHCPSVAVGGFLLGGGMGFNPGAWGYGCMSVAGIDVVTADGALRHASADHDPDLFWAARGGGPGFFGVVTAYHLDLHPDPVALASSTYIYPLDALDEVAAWLEGNADTLDPILEPMIWIGNLEGHTVGALDDDAAPHGAHGDDQRVVMLNAVAFATSRPQAEQALQPLDACPANARALSRDVARASTFTDLFDFQRVLYPPGLRYAVDCQWTDTPPATQPLTALREHLEQAPSARTHALWQMPFANHHGPLPDMALTHLGRFFVSFYTVWESPDDDARNERWLREATGLLDPISTGHYAGDVDLLASPTRAQRTLSATHWERFGELRARFDPDGLFREHLRPSA